MSEEPAGPPPPAPTKYLLRELDPMAREFYERLERGQVATTRCAGCARTAFPPRARCPACEPS